MQARDGEGSARNANVRVGGGVRTARFESAHRSPAPVAVRGNHTIGPFRVEGRRRTSFCARLRRFARTGCRCSGGRPWGCCSTGAILSCRGKCSRKMACRVWGQLGERLRRMTMSGPSAWRSRRAAPRHGAWWRGGGESAVRRAQSHRARAGTPTPTARTFCVASATNHPLPDVPGPKVRVHASSADMSSAA
jgi:hypothetical protein